MASTSVTVDLCAFHVAASSKYNPYKPSTELFRQRPDREFGDPCKAGENVPSQHQVAHVSYDFASETERLVATYYAQDNALFETVFLAYNKHLPLELCPDDLLLPLIQASSQYVRANADVYKSLFVQQGPATSESAQAASLFYGDKPDTGKETLVVEGMAPLLNTRDGWLQAFKQFEEKLCARVAHTDVWSGSFTTTTALHRGVYSIAMMDAMSPWFEYAYATMCGIPSIKLRGTVDDWRQFRDRVTRLIKLVFGAESGAPQPHYYRAVLGVVHMLVNEVEQIATGRAPNHEWWADIVNQQHMGSGTDHLYGWINVFFPYVKEESKTFFDPSGSPGRASNTYCTAVRYADVMTIVSGTRKQMRYWGGQMGTAQNTTTFAVRPAWGFIVSEQTQ